MMKRWWSTAAPGQRYSRAAVGREPAMVVLSGKENVMRLEIRRRGVKVTEELRDYLKERLWLAELRHHAAGLLRGQG